MADTTQDLFVTASMANIYAPQQEGKNAATQKYYVGQALIKDANGRLGNPSAVNKAYPVIGIFVEATEGTDAMAIAADDTFEFSVRTGEYIHFLNSVGAPIVAGTTKPGTPVFFEDNQTVGIDPTAGSWGAVFLGFDAGRLKIGVGPQYWGVNPGASAFAITTAPVVDNSGGAAADGTIGVVTAPAAIVDNSGGVDPGNDTIAIITHAANAGSADFAPVSAAIAQLAAKQNIDRTAIIALTDAIKELSTKLNALINDLKS